MPTTKTVLIPQGLYGKLARKGAGPSNIRHMLQCVGANSAEASVATQSAWLKMRETDKDSMQGIVLLTLVQRGLGLPRTGLYDQATATELNKIFGPNALEATWSRVLEAVSRRRRGQTIPGVPAAYPIPAPSLNGLGATEEQIQNNALQRERTGAPAVSQAKPTWILPGDGTVRALNALTKNAFVELQAQTNRFATLITFTPLKLDGVIGADTINAATRAARWAADHVAPTGGKVGDQAWIAGKMQGANTVEVANKLTWWAQNATWLASILKSNADILKLADRRTGAFLAAPPLAQLPPLTIPPSSPDVATLGLLGLAAYFLLKKKG